jgi:predicted thioredoxin/glutaredoxin
MSGRKPHLTVLSRDGCELCEHMFNELLSEPQAASWRIDVADVDADPAARSRYGHKVPVLLLDGELVCHGALDCEELHKALIARG